MIRVTGDGQEFEPYAETAFELLDLCGNAAVNVVITNDEDMQQINREKRDIDKTTDVLSFPSLSEIKPFTRANYPYDFDRAMRAVAIGDIVINSDAAARQAVEYGTGEREINYLFVHGLLHLLGYDHESESDKAVMREKEEAILNEPQKTARIAVAGRPNAGKSSLVNALVREKVSIVSPKSQTTRDNVLGVCTEGMKQIVFTDTPGRFNPRSKLDEYMEKCVSVGIADSDAVVVVLDAQKGYGEADEDFIRKLLKRGDRVYVALNKIDLTRYERTYPILTKLKDVMGEGGVVEVVPISCKTGENIEELKKLLKRECKEGEFMFDRDAYTDRSLRFIVGETVREKALLFLQDEIPHGVGVAVTSYDESGDTTRVSADIVLEKQSHKPIVIGTGGSMIKRIGEAARKDIERMTGEKVFLELFVKVRPDWRDNPSTLADVGYDVSAKKKKK